VLGALVGAAICHDAYRLAGTGLIGAFTTFSTWAFESHRLGEAGQLRFGVMNFALSRVLGVNRGGGAACRRVAVNHDCLKLTICFGERDRAHGGFLADVLTEIYAHHELQTSVVMRGVQGFGLKHHLHTDGLLTLSEDLPLVSVAVDARSRIESALAEFEVRFDGLVTLERARMLAGRSTPAESLIQAQEDAKLTLHAGRHERAGGRPAYEAVVDMLRSAGVAGATVLLGVDGTTHGERQRPRFFGANTHVPLMVIAVGDGRLIAGPASGAPSLLPHPLLTLKRVRVCKRDGEKLAPPQDLPQADPAGLGSGRSS
jgi:PII-like signaling protein